MIRKLTFEVPFGNVQLIFEVTSTGQAVAHCDTRNINMVMGKQVVWEQFNLDEIDKILVDLKDAREQMAVEMARRVVAKE